MQSPSSFLWTPKVLWYIHSSLIPDWLVQTHWSKIYMEKQALALSQQVSALHMRNRLYLYTK